MKIAFSGVQGTGKTTVINALKPVLKDFVFLTNGIRSLGVHINENGDDDTQIAIAKLHEKNLTYENSVMDRCFLDFFAYTRWMKNHGKISDDIYSSAEKFYTENISKYSVIFYIEPEFEIVADGVRSTDPVFRDEVLKEFRTLVPTLNNVVRLTGSVQDRVHQALAKIREEKK